MVQFYLDVEAALARAQSKIGIIPPEASGAITRKVKTENVDWERLSN